MLMGLMEQFNEVFFVGDTDFIGLPLVAQVEKFLCR